MKPDVYERIMEVVIWLAFGLLLVLMAYLVINWPDNRCERLKALAAEGNDLAAVEAAKRGC